MTKKRAIEIATSCGFKKINYFEKWWNDEDVIWSDKNNIKKIVIDFKNKEWAER
ncbi:MAG: hypothetical protein ACRC4M_01185 [Mycoplasma sp.]